MQLHELPWRQSKYVKTTRKCELPDIKVTIWHYDNDTYSIVRRVYLDLEPGFVSMEEWFDIDALAAQCVLHHLLQSYTNITETPDED